MVAKTVATPLFRVRRGVDGMVAAVEESLEEDEVGQRGTTTMVVM